MSLKILLAQSHRLNGNTSPMERVQHQSHITLLDDKGAVVSFCVSSVRCDQMSVTLRKFIYGLCDDPSVCL
jgi:hypothetical protein